VVLVGAVGLASAAYGIGSQVGDGSAAARDGRNSSSGVASRTAGLADRAFERGAPPGFDLADSLGVDADELEKALREFHEQEAGDRRGDFAEALAGALGIPADRVTEALDGLQDKHKQRFARRLAAELGVETDKVTAALDKLADQRPNGPGGPGDFAEALADELGVDVEKVEDALFAQRPDRGMRGGHHGRMPLRQLADAVRVTRAELRKALRELRAGEESRFEERQDALVKFLADRFNLAEDKVEDALGDLPRPGGPRGPRGPGGPGHHGGPNGPFGP
jgi:hypothetical protein